MDLQRRKNLILKGNIYKVLVTLAIPIMANNIIQCLYNMADGFWVSMIGSVEFAATSFVWPVDFLFISIGSGISIAGTALLSRLIGANKAKEGKKYSAQLFAISLLTSVIFTIIGFILTPLFVRAMGASGDLAHFSNIYLRITFFVFAIFIFLLCF